ncbi:unnamed protein product [Calypogeia fissa]
MGRKHRRRSDRSRQARKQRQATSLGVCCINVHLAKHGLSRFEWSKSRLEYYMLHSPPIIPGFGWRGCRAESTHDAGSVAYW